jgi:8-oxo-dGTP pyrophosphatase MutT (NUDIX family)
MPISDYMRQIRKKVGHDLLVLPSAAIAIHDEQMRLLLCLHSDKNIWVAPGGLVEPGEQPADTAVRETWEETGLVVQITGLLGVYGGTDLMIDYPNGDRAAYIGTIFRGRITGGTFRPDGQEVLELRYFTAEEIRRVPHAKWLDRAMPALFARDGAAHFVGASWKPE